MATSQKLASKIETDRHKKSIESKLVHTEHEETYPEAPVNDDKVYTDLHNDREEIESSNQYANSEHYAIRVKSMEESNGESGMTERLARATDSDADKVDDDKKERDQRSVDDVESVNTIVANKHTVKKDDGVILFKYSLETKNGRKESISGSYH